MQVFALSGPKYAKLLLGSTWHSCRIPRAVPVPRKRRTIWRQMVQPEASSIRIQSLSPSLLFPGGVNWRVPLFANGSPEMVVYIPLAGSNHLACAGAFKAAMFTVIVRAVGM